MKLLGALLWIGSAFLIGHHAARARERRLAQLISLVHALSRLETEVVFGRTPLPEACARVARAHPACSLLFETAASGLAAGRGSERAWGEGVAAFSRSASLLTGDLEPLRPLGGVLGLSDAEDQRRHIRLALGGIEERIEGARERLPEKVRLLRVLGLCGGVAVALLLY